MLPAREVYWNIPRHWLIYPLMLVALTIFLYGFYKRYRLWKLGKPDYRSMKWYRGLKSVLVDGLAQRGILQESYAGIMHSLIFWGFAVLFLGSLMVGAQVHLGFPFLYGKSYLLSSLILDLAGALAVTGVLLAAYRRYIIKPERLDNTADDAVCLLLLFITLVSGFILEGLRIISTNDPWAWWSPAGNTVGLLFSGLFIEERIRWYQFTWWGHLFVAMVFIAYIPYSKLLHVFTSLAGLFWGRTSTRGALSYLDLEDETRESFGVGELRDFTWRQLMDADVCTRCGRCQDNCPVFLTNRSPSLSPKKIIQGLKKHLQEEGPGLIQISNESLVKETAACRESTVNLAGDIISNEAIWLCTTCGSCEEQCPVGIEHLERTIGLRRHLVLMKGDFPREFATVYRNLESNGNPWGIGPAARKEWTEALGVNTQPEDVEVEYLYWLGCASSFDFRNRKVAESVIKLLQITGISFAVMKGERCCGDVARRTGNEYLFQVLARENIQMIKKYRTKTIITSCPHCFNTLKNEYPQLGGEFEVLHHTQVLNRLLKESRFILENNNGADVITFQDPCYLGRHNGIYREPREILEYLPGTELVEMKRNRAKSFCCGAGGGKIWREDVAGTRLNDVRAGEAVKAGARKVITACPFCLLMLDDGLKAIKEEVKVMDISEVLLEAVQEK